MPNNSNDNIGNKKKLNSLKSGIKNLDLSKPVVMGILNLTPDSFYVGSRSNGIHDLLDRADKHLREGAKILDLGAVSTRPGAKKISEENELERIVSSLQILRDTFPECWISVDTWRSSVAKVCLNEGADIINDISGGCFDENMLTLIAENNTPYIMMHIKGSPDNMQNNPTYDDVKEEVFEFFKKQTLEFEKAGATQLIIDPGYGFGKTVDHNYELIRESFYFKQLGYPVLIGISRKSMITKLLNINTEDALNGTTVLHTLALLNGANILRVHDVKEAVETIEIISKINE